MRVNSLHEDLRNFLFKQGCTIPAIGDVRMVLKNATNSQSYWRGKLPSDRIHGTVADAIANMNNSLQNDALIIPPESHSLAAALTISANGIHVVGAAAPGWLNVRTRIGMSTTFTPMITVSGYGNSFWNLYTMHGTAAGDYIGWLISGARNSFHRVHFGGPMAALQGGHASYEGVAIDGSENNFEDCIFGTNTIGRDEASPNVTLGAGTITRFKGCHFLCQLTDGDPYFVTVENTSGYTEAFFEDCMFIAMNPNWATAMTKAFDFTGGATAGMYFNNNCQFINVTALSSADEDQYIFLPRQFVTTTDTEGMISPKLTI